MSLRIRVPSSGQLVLDDVFLECGLYDLLAEAVAFQRVIVEAQVRVALATLLVALLELLSLQSVLCDVLTHPSYTDSVHRIFVNAEEILLMLVMTLSLKQLFIVYCQN